jgi:hypothetical protein
MALGGFDVCSIGSRERACIDRPVDLLEKRPTRRTLSLDEGLVSVLKTLTPFDGMLVADQYPVEADRFDQQPQRTLVEERSACTTSHRSHNVIETIGVSTAKMVFARADWA